MRIITPENAAMTPSGAGANPILAATYEFEDTVSGDFAFIYDDFLLPQDGTYLLNLYIKIILSDSASGTLSTRVYNPFLATVLVTAAQNPADTGFFNGNSLYSPVSSDNGVLQVGRELSGFAGSSVTYRITASAFRLC